MSEGHRKQKGQKKGRPGKFFKNEDMRSKKPEEITENKAEGTVEFLNINMLKKNSVRGLLRKRAKKYECKG